MSKKILVAASNNNGKIKEIKEIFTDYDILSISEMEKKLGKKIIVIENQMTFSGNTKEKVNCLYQEIGDDYICIGDDSGISIDALDGFSGEIIDTILSDMRRVYIEELDKIFTF